MDRKEKDFDPTRPLAMTRGARLNGHDLARLAAVRIVEDESDKPGEISEELARRIWVNGAIEYADEMVATPVEDPLTGVTALVETDDLGNGNFLLRAPWRPEGIKVRGRENAAEEREKLIREGLTHIDYRRPPEEREFVVVEAGSNGWFQITGPGLSEPLRVRGEEAANQKRDELARASITPVVEVPPPPPPAPAPEPVGEPDGA